VGKVSLREFIVQFKSKRRVAFSFGHPPKCSVFGELY